jgi:hypothetical protein
MDNINSIKAGIDVHTISSSLECTNLEENLLFCSTKKYNVKNKTQVTKLIITTKRKDKWLLKLKIPSMDTVAGSWKYI